MTADTTGPCAAPHGLLPVDALTAKPPGSAVVALQNALVAMVTATALKVSPLE